MEATYQGYADESYAVSLSEWGIPRELRCSGGWLLEREIPNTPYKDLMGCYPLFSCLSWEKMEADLAMLTSEAITLSMVPSPFLFKKPDGLQRLFPDRHLHFKDHFIVDLRLPLKKSISSHHRYYSRKAMREFEISFESKPGYLLGKWLELYAKLIKRHGIQGLQAFSKQVFDIQLQMDGMTAAVATCRGEVAGIQLWLHENKNVFHHLSAYSDEGYRKRVSYALLWAALEREQAQGTIYADLGGGSGLKSAEDGLTAFKRGWATETRPVFFCGRIFDQNAYAALLKNTENRGYFPAYRQGEFG